MESNIYFISGIDTDAGKSYCTAWYAKQLSLNGQRIITQKFIQTGNTGHSEDIDLHRRIMGTGYLPEDKEGLTMPEIFSYPCSPHLAAHIDNRPIDFNKIERSTQELARRYDTVFIEGNHFNDYSCALINGKEYATEKISDRLLRVKGAKVKKDDLVTVAQKGDDKVELSRTTFAVKQQAKQ